MASSFVYGQSLQQLCDSSIVAKRLADVGEPIYISRTEHKAAAKLKRILT
jgi:hypothetical protein